MKKRLIIVSSLIAVMTMGSVAQVSAYTYEPFPHTFVYAIGMPSSQVYITQQVAVYSNAAQKAYAKCSHFTYSGDHPSLKVDSVSANFPTNSTTITSSTYLPK